MITNLAVVGLHKLPFDQRQFEGELSTIADHDVESRSILIAQFRENWDNAWIVVVEWQGEDVDFGLFNHPHRGPDAQAAWMEQMLDSSGPVKRAAFFLHFVEPSKPLWYGDQALPLSPITEAPESLLKTMEYSSPD